MSKINISEIKRSNRRSISIEITREGKLVVKAPYLIPKIIIENFVNRKRNWILKHLKKYSSKRTGKREYVEDEEFLYLGKKYNLHYGSYTEISVSDIGKLHIPIATKFRAEKEIELFYRKTAMELITKRVEVNAKMMKLSYGAITFSDTKSKWGTCTYHNNLQFNWRLIMAPLEVVDYVIVHELTHITHKNHSRKFWNNVSFYKPAYKQHRKWLSLNSHRLFI